MTKPKFSETSADTGAPPMLLLIGGFLGAGKTTLIQRLIRLLAESGKSCGVIANDQGTSLLDTSNARRSGPAAVAEVSGGCFCCRLEELVEVVKAMSANERPDVILAEPVGSCTDLVATVIRPLEQIYQIPLRLCPLSVQQFSGVFAADESYFGTVLSLAGWNMKTQVVAKCPTWTQWAFQNSGPTCHSAVDGQTAARIAESGCFFARKFGVDSNIGRWRLHSRAGRDER